ncbi:MAG: helix-turn-helix domain-containing protein [Planctomycetota bacterium]
MCEFEKAILKAIEEAGLSQVELAAKSGVSQGLISLFTESDPMKRRTITLPVADRLCRALGLKLVQKKKAKKGDKKMSERFYFREECDIERVRELCMHPIRQRRGKMVCEQILKELDSGFLTKNSKNWLSAWVNPDRREPKVEDSFKAICNELFGRRIARNEDYKCR